MTDLYNAAVATRPLDRTDMRTHFLCEILKTQPDPYRVAMIYALLLPPIPTPTKNTLSWLVRDGTAEVWSDGALLRARPRSREGSCTRAVFTDLPLGRYKVIPDPVSGPPRTSDGYPIRDEQLRVLRPVIAEDYPLRAAFGPLDVRWTDEERLYQPCYQLPGDVYVQAWVWGTCAGRAEARVHIHTQYHVDGRLNRHASAVFLELPQDNGPPRYARIPQITPPIRRHDYVSELAEVARRVCLGRLPMKKKVRRYLYENAGALGLSDSLMIKLFRYCMGN